MRKTIWIVLMALVPLMSFAQEAAVDPKAKSLLDKAIASFETKKGLSAEFVIKVQNTRSDKEMSHKGSVLLKSEKFKLIIEGTETYFDGKTQSVMMTKENEVTISNPDADDLKDINPILLMKSCKTDYKMRYLGQVMVNNVLMEKVELYPNDLKSKYSIITLLLNKESLMLDTITLKSKDGIMTQFHITKYETKALNDLLFVFDKKAHPGVEVIDLR